MSLAFSHILKLREWISLEQEERYLQGLASYINSFKGATHQTVLIQAEFIMASTKSNK